MKRMNCWEVKACGRGPGGENVEGHGVCPAALPNEFDGVNRGEHAGRFCWAVAGTLCGGEVQGSFAAKLMTCIPREFLKQVQAAKLMNCLFCEFLKQVQEEEGTTFRLTPWEERKGRDRAGELSVPGRRRHG